eukprot:COSAG01_NODE_42065_length_444_cov_0.576812_1_plen_51_part_10
MLGTPSPSPCIYEATQSPVPGRLLVLRYLNKVQKGVDVSAAVRRSYATARD